MSTKTTFKRIALVAVASLGFGMLSAAPSSATVATVAIVELDATDAATANLYTTAGTAVTLPIYLETTTATTEADTITLTPSITSQPAGGTLEVGAAGQDKVGMTTAGTLGANVATTAAATKHTLAVSAGVATLVWSEGTIPAFADDSEQVVGTISITPTIPGKYVIALTPTGATTTNTAATINVFVSGTALTVAQTGVGSTSGVGVAGGQVSFSYTTPNGTAVGTKYNVTVTGGNLISGTGVRTGGGANNPTNINGTTAADGLTFTTVTETTSGVYTFNAAVPTAGAFAATISSINTSTGVPTVVGTLSVTVTATASSSVSAALSSAFIGTGQAACATADATASALRFSATAGAAANICVTLRDINGAAINGQSVSVTVSGPGLVIAEADQDGTVAAGTARVDALTATEMASSNVAQIGINSDGTRGASTISIFAGTTLIATKSLTFYGAVASLTATQNYAIARSGITSATLAASSTANKLGSATSADTGLTVATSPAVTVVAKDVDGNVVPGVTVTGVIADATVLSSVEIAEAAGAALTIGAAGGGTHLVAVRSAIGGVSGASTTVTFRTPHPTVGGTFITADPVTFTLGGTKTGGTVTMSTDKSSYEPGERMTITINALDASGNKVYDGVSTGTPNASKSIVGLDAFPDAFVDGEFAYGSGATEFLYAPTSSGAFTITLATGTATGATISATLAVADDASTAAANAASDAASEAIDAANAATDAANLAAEAADAATVAAEEARDAADAATAAVEALATEVATLMAALKAQITTLANVVAKIAKRTKS